MKYPMKIATKNALVINSFGLIYQELINALYRGKEPNKENYDALYSPEKILVLGANFMS